MTLNTLIGAVNTSIAAGQIDASGGRSLRAYEAGAHRIEQRPDAAGGAVSALPFKRESLSAAPGTGELRFMEHRERAGVPG